MDGAGCHYALVSADHVGVVELCLAAPHAPRPGACQLAPAGLAGGNLRHHDLTGGNRGPRVGCTVQPL
eukprot:1312108-Alexandrium_andersonii.AAC.1